MLDRETFAQLDARIASEMREEEVEEGIVPSTDRAKADGEADEWLRGRQSKRRHARLRRAKLCGF